MRILVVALAASWASLLAGCSDEPSAGECTDVTSIDYNWDNDMLCKRQDGSTFHTDYGGAEEFESRR
jgi:hypothetical protein